MTIWTVGHSTHSLGDFIKLLKRNSIGLAADVRSYPGSRKFPHFEKESLRMSLGEAGIDYRHFPGLGGRRRKVRPDSHNDAWRSSGFQAYADHMETEEFADAARELLDLAREKRTVVMCAESLWWRCHRQLISDYLKVRGHKVMHIGPDGGQEEHPYSSPAKVNRGHLSYAAEQ
jgi:uncharacterized protein (DUF488 family)